MKTTAILLLALIISLNANAQNQAETFIKEAEGFLANKQYKQAQLSLQDAINDINLMLAKQVAASLPSEINGLKAEGEGDINASSMGMIGGGIQIAKRYNNEKIKENNAEVQLMANSPLLASMNMYITNPGIMGPNYKSVRIGTYRAILKSEMIDFYDDQGGSKKIRSTEIQVPVGQTLITINAKGFLDESAELAFATKLDLEKIKTALGE